MFITLSLKIMSTGNFSFVINYSSKWVLGLLRKVMNSHFRKKMYICRKTDYSISGGSQIHL